MTRKKEIKTHVKIQTFRRTLSKKATERQGKKKQIELHISASTANTSSTANIVIKLTNCLITYFPITLHGK